MGLKDEKILDFFKAIINKGDDETKKRFHTVLQNILNAGSIKNAKSIVDNLLKRWHL